MADLRNRKPGWRRCRRLWTSNGRGVPQGCASARALKPNALQQSCWLDAWACEGRTLTLPPILLARFDGVSMVYLSRTCLVPPMWIAIHLGGTRQVRDRYETGVWEAHRDNSVSEPGFPAGFADTPARRRFLWFYCLPVASIKNVVFLRKLWVLLPGAGSCCGRRP